MLKFGDTFKYREKDYVYLVKTEEITYAAEILNVDDSKWINKVYERKIMNTAIKEKVSSMPIYCFVMLRTEPFQGRAAHFLNTGKGDTASGDCVSLEPIKSLEKIDLKGILDEIVKGPVPKELKQLTKEIEIESS